MCHWVHPPYLPVHKESQWTSLSSQQGSWKLLLLVLAFLVSFKNIVFYVMFFYVMLLAVFWAWSDQVTTILDQGWHSKCWDRVCEPLDSESVHNCLVEQILFSEELRPHCPLITRRLFGSATWRSSCPHGVQETCHLKVVFFSPDRKTQKSENLIPRQKGIYSLFAMRCHDSQKRNPQNSLTWSFAWSAKQDTTHNQTKDKEVVPPSSDKILSAFNDRRSSFLLSSAIFDKNSSSTKFNTFCGATASCFDKEKQKEYYILPDSITNIYRFIIATRERNSWI